MERFQIGMDIRKVVTAENMNEIRDAVERINGDMMQQNGGAVRIARVRRDGEIRIMLAGNTGLDIFSAVELSGLFLTPANCEDFNFETVTFTGGTATESRLPWAICVEPATPGELTRAIMSGITPAVVTISSESHWCARPVVGSATGALESCESSEAKILWRAGSSGMQWCILQLGAAAPAAAAGVSHAPFALSIGGGTTTVNVAAGIASRNGVKVSVAGGTVTATASGYVYVATTFSTVSGWGSGFSFGVASGLSDLVAVTGGSITTECYPVGYVTVTGGVVTEVESFKVPMAIFLKAGTCTTGA